MIYDTKVGFAFIHVPRTGGMAITSALERLFPSAISDTKKERHLNAGVLSSRVLDQWDGLFRFAFIRDPLAVCESDFRLTQRDMETPPVPIGEDWQNRLERMRKEPGFPAFVEREWLGKHSGIKDGGLWTTFCERTGESLGVLPFLFTGIQQSWRAICVRLGIPPFPLPKENGVNVREPIQWPKSLSEAVRGLCWKDYVLFDL